MIQRVNFVERGPYTLTYRDMLLFAGLLCAACIAVHGIFIFRHMLVKNKTARLTRQVQELSIYKEKALAALQIAQTRSTGFIAPLASLFVKMPVWSQALSDISKSMPTQIWFKNIRSSSIGEQSDTRKLEISGGSTSHAAVAQFIKSLEDSKLFKSTMLVNSQKEKTGYSFLINTEVWFPTVDW